MLFALSANPTGNDFREDFAMRSETKPSQDEEKNGQEPLLPPIQPVIDFGSVVIKNSRAAIHCLTIAGQIEGHMQLPNTQKATKYEHVLPLLAYLEESEDIDGVLFLLNTVGGDVEAGLAIAELISGMKKPTVSFTPAATSRRVSSFGRRTTNTADALTQNF